MFKRNVAILFWFIMVAETVLAGVSFQQGNWYLAGLFVITVFITLDGLFKIAESK